jgi:hypothetical protein
MAKRKKDDEEYRWVVKPCDRIVVSIIIVLLLYPQNNYLGGSEP